MTSKDTENMLIAQMRSIGRTDLADRIGRGDSEAVTDAMIERSRWQRRQYRRSEMRDD